MFAYRPKSAHFAVLIFLFLSWSIFGINAQASGLGALFKDYQAALAEADSDAIMEKASAVYEYARQNLPQDSKSRAAATLNYSKALFAARKFQAADDLSEEALERFIASYGDVAQELLDPYLERARTVAGNLGASSGHRQTHRHYLRKALKIAEQLQGKDSQLFAIISLEAGRIALDNAGSNTAFRYLEDAHEAFSGPYKDSTIYRFQANFYMGKYLMARKKYRTAQPYFEEALAVADTEGAPDSKLEMTVRAFLVDIYESVGESEKSIAQCRAIGKMVPFNMDQEPQSLFRRMPTYPAAALQSRREGYAVVSFTISDSGIPTDIETVETEGSDSFGVAAEDYIRGLRYAPRFENGEPVDTPDRKFKVSFSLAK
ncbi:energy transducer TonB [Microbulbifer sp.]|uniref:energy transducer TonB n=1 Tax=Microbulbifer sp. TaxID=1908541 RepID=UPI002F959E7E